MRLALPAVVVSLLCLTAASAQQPPLAVPPPPADAAPQLPATAATTAQLHDELRQIRDDVQAAVKRGDVEGILGHLHPNIVFLPMNGEVVRGPLQVRDYFNKMLKGPERRAQSVDLKAEVVDLNSYSGNTGVAYGTSEDHYVLANNSELKVNTNWTASLVQENGKWLITSFQVAPNAFDNAILTQQKRSAAMNGGIAGLATGLVLGLLLMAWSWKRRRAKARTAV